MPSFDILKEPFKNLKNYTSNATRKSQLCLFLSRVIDLIKNVVNLSTATSYESCSPV